MSESPAPDVAENAARPDPQALTPEAIDAVLADFRGWLIELGARSAGRGAEEGDSVPRSPLRAPSSEEPPDLYTLLAQFTALRHEVNLQTRATRAQQEHNAESLRHLTEALDALREAHAALDESRERADEERLRPLLKSLVELHDAVALAGREMTRVQETVLPTLAQIVEAANGDQAPFEFDIGSPPPPPQSWWSRWFGRPAPPAGATGLKERLAAHFQVERLKRRERGRQAAEGVERVRQLLASLATGYTMSLQRVERTLRQHGLEPIAAVGQPFDPERMEVVEAVSDSGRPGGEVLGEVRRGYLWNGRVFRFAQVRVAKP
jgi:molecular chaperone GrpE